MAAPNAPTPLSKLSHLHIITTEVQHLSAAMRGNARWASSSASVRRPGWRASPMSPLTGGRVRTAT